ncbi:MAG: DUF1905 domain-containing protein [Bacteroidota bacterium]
MFIKQEQRLLKLAPRKGGYYYLRIDKEKVDKMPKKKATRLVITIDQCISYSCGLNHLGDGNFFIIVAGKYVKKLQKNEGDPVSFEMIEDPNPLGVPMPEVLEVLLAQDEELNRKFEKLTDGKKRSLIYFTTSVKDIDKQVQKALAFLNGEVNMKKKTT